MGSRRTDDLFVVRVWREAGMSDMTWRAYVEHLGTGKRRYFTALDELTGFIRGRLEDASATGSGELEEELTDFVRT
jgi:hypothetical protein